MPSITCVNCCRAVPASDLDELAGLAVCRVCKTVIELPSVDRRGSPDDPHGLESHGRVSTPPDVSVRFTDDISPTAYRGKVKRELFMSWPMEGHAASRTLPLILSTFMWLCTYIALSTVKTAETGLQLILAAAMGVPACIITYLSLALHLNRIHLTVARGLLQIRHAPLPWVGGDKSVPVDRIQRVYCSRKTSGRHGTSFALNVVLNSRETHTLLSHLKDPTTARHLKQCIEDSLNLE